MKEADKVLEDELGRAAARSDAWGAAIGARWAARHLPNNAFGASMELEISAREALAKFTDVSRALGRLVEHEATDIDAKFTPVGDQNCRVTITGSAKEGLIKQRAGEVAVRKILAATRFGAPPIE